MELLYTEFLDNYLCYVTRRCGYIVVCGLKFISLGVYGMFICLCLQYHGKLELRGLLL